MRKPFTKAGPGRPKGLQNKVTVAAKEAIQQAFEKLGGVDSLVEFGQKNPAVFYGSIWPKILPLDVKHGGQVEMTHRYDIPNKRPIG